MTEAIRHDWNVAEIRAILRHAIARFDLSRRDGASPASRRARDAGVQVDFHQDRRVPEDCAYCAQSARYETGIAPQPLLDKATVVEIARRAKENGVSRVCMGAAWREVKDNAQFDRVLEMVKDVTDMGIEVCCTLGMLTESQGQAPRSARPLRLQPQRRYLGRILRDDHHDAHLRGPAEHDQERSHDERDCLLRRYHWHGRKRAGPRFDAAHACDDAPAP
jgi:hypothetical protein